MNMRNKKRLYPNDWYTNNCSIREQYKRQRDTPHVKQVICEARLDAFTLSHNFTRQQEQQNYVKDPLSLSGASQLPQSHGSCRVWNSSYAVCTSTLLTADQRQSRLSQQGYRCHAAAVARSAVDAAHPVVTETGCSCPLTCPAPGLSLVGLQWGFL